MENKNKNPISVPMNVVLYLRYSSDKQNEQSIEGQRRVCEDYCRRTNMTIVGIYIDRALSASKNAEKREDFQKLIKDSEKHTFEAVVVYKLDRFARNRYDSAVYKSKLKKNGVRVVSATENISDTPEGIILESVLEGMAEFYSRELAQKVTRGMHETALKCHSCGGSTPLGFKIENKKYIIDDLTAPIVREAFQRYADGETIQTIIADFNGRGYRTASGKLFNKNSFKSMFHNEKYIGVYQYKDVRIEGGIPAIIDVDLFKRVSERCDMNKHAPATAKAKTEYLLSQKLFCGHCGSLMVGDSGTNPSKDTYYYYSCRKKKAHECDKKSVRKDWIEDVVVEDTLSLLTPQFIADIAEKVEAYSEEEVLNNKTIPAIKARIAEADKAIKNLAKALEQGSMSPTILNRLSELETEKTQLEAELESASAEIAIVDRYQVMWWLEQFSNGDKTDADFRRRLIDTLVNSVTIWDNPDGTKKITILYNLRDNNTHTVNCSDLSRDGSPREYYPNIFVYSCAIFGVIRTY